MSGSTVTPAAATLGTSIPAQSGNIGYYILQLRWSYGQACMCGCVVMQLLHLLRMNRIKENDLVTGNSGGLGLSGLT